MSNVVKLNVTTNESVAIFSRSTARNGTRARHRPRSWACTRSPTCVTRTWTRAHRTTSRAATTHGKNGSGTNMLYTGTHARPPPTAYGRPIRPERCPKTAMRTVLEHDGDACQQLTHHQAAPPIYILAFTHCASLEGWSESHNLARTMHRRRGEEREDITAQPAVWSRAPPQNKLT